MSRNKEDSIRSVETEGERMEKRRKERDSQSMYYFLLEVILHLIAETGTIKPGSPEFKGIIAVSSRARTI